MYNLYCGLNTHYYICEMVLRLKSQNIQQLLLSFHFSFDVEKTILRNAKWELKKKKKLNETYERRSNCARMEAIRKYLILDTYL